MVSGFVDFNLIHNVASCSPYAGNRIMSFISIELHPCLLRMLLSYNVMVELLAPLCKSRHINNNASVKEGFYEYDRVVRSEDDNISSLRAQYVSPE